MEHTIDKYSKLVWYIIATVLNSIAHVEDIEECVADVFVYLWQNSDKFNAERGSLKSWLVVVAKSKAVDRFRIISKSRETELNDEITETDTSLMDGIISAESKREIVAAINALAEPDREIIIRRFYYQQKPKEIAFALGLPVKQVNNRLYSAKAQLRKSLSQI